MDSSRLPEAIPSCSQATVKAEAPRLTELLESDPDLAVFTPSSEYYSMLHETINHSNNIAPEAVIRPKTEKQVSAIVRFCSQHGIKIAVLSSGNDIGSRSRVGSQGAVLIDLRDMCSISINKTASTAEIGGGTSCVQFCRILEDHGLSTPMPFAAVLGYAGWACGGGYGILSNPLGLGVDHILAARVVLADGSVMDTDVDGTDLLWALRGGGAGALGVITQLRVKLYPQAKILGGFVSFPSQEAATIFPALDKLFAENKPPKFTCDLMLTNPDSQADAVLTFVVAWLLDQDRGDYDEAKQFLSSFESLGTLLMSAVSESESQSCF